MGEFMGTVVISLGGSILISDDADTAFLQQLATLLEKISTSYKLYIVVGGGRTARIYINKGRELGFSEEVLDEFGIAITRVNAKMLAQIVTGANIDIPVTTDAAAKLKSDIVVMGGTTPGHSTDLVGAELAEKVSADRYIIATNVDGIYDKDPNKHADAKQFKEIAIDALIQMYGTKWDAAGKNVVIDGPALKIIKQAKLSTFVVNGARLNDLGNALSGSAFKGTVITQ